MKTTFNDFINSNPNCSKYDGNAEAILIFEFLSRDESIIQMVEASENGKPALSPVVKDIEDLLDNVANPTISFEDNFTKQTVGLMVKSILEPFGYKVKAQKALPKSSGARKFVSASCYEYDENAPASLRIVKRIENI